MEKVFYHIPGLFEFYDLYKAFLPLWRDHREYFYDWCEIGSIYGAPSDCLWGGGRVGFGDAEPEKVAALVKEYGISARLTFSNSLIREEHLADVECNALCRMFESADTGLVDGRNGAGNGAGLDGAEFDAGLDGAGIIVHSDLLLDYIRAKYPGFYFISSTTKVITDFGQFVAELNRNDFRYVVPDFRLNRQIDKLSTLTDVQKQKVEFLCNECCWFGCHDRKACYENVSRKSLGENCEDHVCVSPTAQRGYLRPRDSGTSKSKAAASAVRSS